MVVLYPVMVPIASPVMPPPAVTPEPTDFESSSPPNVGSRIPSPRIFVPSRPGHDHRGPIHNPGIVGRDVDHLGVGRFNNDGFALGLYDLLLCCLQIAGLFGFPTHDLHGSHYVRLLVVIGVSQR